MPLVIAEEFLPPEIRKRLSKPKVSDYRTSGGRGGRIFVLGSAEDKDKKLKK